MDKSKSRTMPKSETSAFKNICPNCKCDMGMKWFSQYCSRACMNFGTSESPPRSPKSEAQPVSAPQMIPPPAAAPEAGFRNQLVINELFGERVLPTKTTFKNICPNCECDMGMKWFSQYCSRACMFSR